MPTWDPPPDVRFDHSAARALAASAHAAERELDRLARSTRRVHESAAATWRGRARQRADDHLERWWFALAGVIADLRALIVQVTEAAAAAQAEQARRSAARIRRQTEAEDERQAEAAAVTADGGGERR